VGSIIKKMKNGRPYYYAVKSARVNGKPRIVWQKYLGTFDQLTRDQEETTIKPIESVISEAGGVAALLHIANRIDVIKLIDKVCKKRSQGPSLGHYILLAALNRALDPCSKAGIGEWYEKTILKRIWGFEKSAFTSQRFWDHMDKLSLESIEILQEQIAKIVINNFNVDPTALLYDSTNFFTFIESGNQRCTIAQRGLNKQKRSNLRQVGLALIVTKDWEIPLFHRCYEGNRADRGLFTEIAKELRERHKVLFGAKESTYVFDKGNVSNDAMEDIIVSGNNFVIALPSSEVSEFFETDIEKFEMADSLPGTRSFSMPIIYYGKECKLVIVHSESFFAEQLNSITNNIQKCERQLKELHIKLQRWREGKNKSGRPPSLQEIKKQIKEILSKEYIKELYTVNIDETQKIPQIKYSFNQTQYNYLQQYRLGRTALLTNQTNLSSENVIIAYRSLHHIEDAFKRMKNSDFLSWQPSFHWTDQKIRVHAFYCVLALLLASLARKIARQAEIEISLWKLLDELSDIREVAIIYPEGSGMNEFIMSRMSSRQKRLAELFEIGAIVQG
jgi:transposase